MRLAQLRLKALVGSLQSRQDNDSSKLLASDFSIGAAFIVGTEGWVLVTQSPERGLGPALLWMHKYHLSRLNVIVDAQDTAGVMARRAQLFDLDVMVWFVDGNVLTAAKPAPVLLPLNVPDKYRLFSKTIERAGATVVCEHGVLSGEVLGLEVCRVVNDPHIENKARLEIGVGSNDRELFQMVNGSDASEESLTNVVKTVLQHRQVGAAMHPLNRLGAERFLREVLIAKPGLVGAHHLNRAEPPVARSNLKDAIPCVAFGEALNRPVVVVCSAIIDTDLVPFAADARLHLEPGAELVLAVAPNNVMPSMTHLADTLHQPARFIVVDEFRR